MIHIEVRLDVDEITSEKENMNKKKKEIDNDEQDD